jgi:hypothetical protein
MTTVTQEQAAVMAGQLVNGQNGYAIGAGGGMGLLTAVVHIYKEDDSSETITDLFAGVTGGILGQATVFYIASRPTSTNTAVSYLQQKCAWLLKTPLPALIGATSIIGIRILIGSHQSS